jgi:hypothetical protein
MISEQDRVKPRWKWRGILKGGEEEKGEERKRKKEKEKKMSRTRDMVCGWSPLIRLLQRTAWNNIVIWGGLEDHMFFLSAHALKYFKVLLAG